MTLYQIKPAFQALLRPLMFRLHKKGVTANHVTLAAMALSIVTGAVLVVFPHPQYFILLPGVLFIRMALNALDGMLARECNQQSRLGAILNESGDILSDLAVLLLRQGGAQLLDKAAKVGQNFPRIGFALKQTGRNGVAGIKQLCNLHLF